MKACSVIQTFPTLLISTKKIRRKKFFEMKRERGNVDKDMNLVVCAEKVGELD